MVEILPGNKSKGIVTFELKASLKGPVCDHCYFNYYSQGYWKQNAKESSEIPLTVMYSAFCFPLKFAVNLKLLDWDASQNGYTSFMGTPLKSHIHLWSTLKE